MIAGAVIGGMGAPGGLLGPSVKPGNRYNPGGFKRSKTGELWVPWHSQHLQNKGNNMAIMAPRNKQEAAFQRQNYGGRPRRFRTSGGFSGGPGGFGGRRTPSGRGSGGFAGGRVGEGGVLRGGALGGYRYGGGSVPDSSHLVNQPYTQRTRRFNAPQGGGGTSKEMEGLRGAFEKDRWENAGPKGYTNIRGEFVPYENEPDAYTTQGEAIYDKPQQGQRILKATKNKPLSLVDRNNRSVSQAYANEMTRMPSNKPIRKLKATKVEEGPRRLKVSKNLDPTTGPLYDERGELRWDSRDGKYIPKPAKNLKVSKNQTPTQGPLTDKDGNQLVWNDAVKQYTVLPQPRRFSPKPKPQTNRFETKNTYQGDMTPISGVEIEAAPDLPQHVDAAQVENRVAGPQYSETIEGPDSGAANLSRFSDFRGDMDRVEQATYDRAMKRLQPGFDRDMASLRTRLANQGIPEGSPAYTEAIDNEMRRQRDAMESAAYSAVRAGRQEHSRLLGENRATESQRFGQDLASRQFRAGEQGRRFNESTQRAAHDQREADRLFNQSQRGREFTADQYGNRFDRHLRSNAQTFGQRMANAQLALQDRNARNAQGNLNRDYGLREAQQNYAQDMGIKGFDHTSGLDTRRFNLAEDQQRYAQDLGDRQFGLTEDQQRYAQDMGRRGFGAQENQRAIENARQQREMDWMYGQRAFYDPIQRTQALAGLSNVYRQVAAPSFAQMPGVNVQAPDFMSQKQQWEQNKAANSGQGWGMLGGLINTGLQAGMNYMMPGSSMMIGGGMGGGMGGGVYPTFPMM